MRRGGVIGGVLVASATAASCSVISSFDGFGGALSGPPDGSPTLRPDATTSGSPDTGTGTGDEPPESDGGDLQGDGAPPDEDAGLDDSGVKYSMTSDGKLLPGPPPTLCSRNSTTQKLTFSNTGADPLEIWWANGSCKEQYYYQVAPNASKVQSTYQNHVWIIRAVGTHAFVRQINPRPNANATTITVP